MKWLVCSETDFCRVGFKHRLDFRRSLEPEFGGRARAHFPEQRLVIEPNSNKDLPCSLIRTAISFQGENERRYKFSEAVIEPRTQNESPP